MKTRSWILLFGAIAALCIAACFFLFGGEAKTTAEISVDGKLYRTVSLQEDRVLQIDTPHGHNTVEIAGGKLQVIAADCPDGFCMAQPPRNSGAPIVCLPHRLVISFVSGEYDAVSR